LIWSFRKIGISEKIGIFLSRNPSVIQPNDAGNANALSFGVDASNQVGMALKGEYYHPS
jgi:hypothetical protein